MEVNMKKIRLNMVSLAVLAAMLLTACGISVQLPGQVANLLGAPAAAAEQVAAPTATAVTAPTTPLVDANTSGLLAAYQETLTRLYEQASPSVVNIRVLVNSDVASFGGQLPELPFDLPNLPNLPGTPNNEGNPDAQLPPSQGVGSGFVWDGEGHIVTNNHVVDGAEKIEVVFADGTTVEAELVGTDPDSDLAVIKVDVPEDQLQPVQVADSDQVKVGQLAIAIGNPFGLEGTMTVGIVSALGRTLPASEGFTTGPVYSIPDIIQTDAPINPGNSGGVLVNADGQVIGVTAAIESPVRANAGVGFVIPSNIVRQVVPSLIESGSFAHPYLGISGTDLSPDLAKAMDLDAGTRGALVIEVSPNTPADKAGLRGSDRQITIDGLEARVGGDVIVAIDGQPVNDMDDLIAYLSRSTVVGQNVTLTVLRDGSQTQVNVTLEARPGKAVPQTETAQASGNVWLGIRGQTLTADLAQAMDLSPDQQGVLVQQVEGSSPADEAGLRGSFKPLDINGQQVLVGGDVITGLDGQSVTSIEQLASSVQQYSPGDEVTLNILRDGRQTELTVTLAERPQ
jgi:serine protease Do